MIGAKADVGHCFAQLLQGMKRASKVVLWTWLTRADAARPRGSPESKCKEIKEQDLAGLWSLSFEAPFRSSHDSMMMIFADKVHFADERLS